MTFDWDKLKENLQDNAFGEQKKTFEVDTRFYKLSRDENDNGGALIRFLPDADSMPFVKMTQINAQQGKNKPFISEWSPQTIGKPDPINERFSKLWNEGKKEEAKKYGRKFRYLTNIKVIKDPANPENEGKIFLFDMSPTLFDKIKNAVAPSESEIALGAEAINVFDPLSAPNFLLKVKMGSNGFLTYEDSKFADSKSPAFESEEEAVKSVKEDTHSLNEFLKPESFMSYEDLQKKLDWFDGIKADDETTTQSSSEGTTTQTVQTVTTEPVAEPKQEQTSTSSAQKELDSIDDILDDIL